MCTALNRKDPNVKDQTTGFNGDNDPLDVCEIGSKVQTRGAVVQVKVLGALGLIDEGEADWKIIAIDITDPLAGKLNDINDVETHLPGLLDATRDWFRIYKVPTGKPANIFADNGRFFDKSFALKQIHHDYELWHDLLKGIYLTKHNTAVCLLNDKQITDLKEFMRRRQRNRKVLAWLIQATWRE